MASVDSKFAEVALRDALEGAHKAAVARLTAAGVFAAVLTGASLAAMHSKSYGFLLLGELLVILLLVVEVVLRKSQQSYHYRYIEIAAALYDRPNDYLWLTMSTPPALLESFAELACDTSLTDQQRHAKLKQLLGFWKHRNFSMLVAVLALAYTILAIYAAFFARWPFLPT